MMTGVKNKKQIQASGITLIALVITIVILIILATVGISFVFGEDGLIAKAQQSAELTKVESIKEQMELAKADVAMENGGKVDVDDFFEKLEQDGVIGSVENDVTDNGDGTYDVVTDDGYEFEVTVTPEGEIEIEYTGKGEGPRISNVNITKTSNSVTIEIETKNAEGGKFTYSYKKNSEGEESWQEAETNTTSNTCTIENLEANEIYNIKINIETSKGKVEKIVNVQLGEMPQGAITFDDYVWQGDGTANIIINTTEIGYTLQYQIVGAEGGMPADNSWIDTTSGATITGLKYGDTVYGRLWDGTNESDYANATIEDKLPPQAASINLSGTAGNNNYYKSDVTVTITAGNDEQSGANQIRYSVSGAQTMSQTTTGEGTTSTNITITADGTSTITAYTLDKAGNVSEEKTQTVYKDATVPTASLVVGTAEKTTIEVTATGNDSLSGVASYTFQYSTTSATSGFTTKEEVTNTSNSCTYTYEELTAGTTYYLRVIVKDRAGNAKTSTAVTSKTKNPILSEEELEDSGSKYVDYKPVSGNFTSSSTYNGYGNQNFSTVTSLKWRILKVDNNKLTLISDTTANTNFYLKGANGYNNGVLLLNNACKAMYSNSSLGATARSLKIEDIEAHSTFNKTSYYNPSLANADGGNVWYGVEYGKGESQGYYPKIFEQEKTGAPRGTYGTKYGQSDQDSYITGTAIGTSSFKAIYTHYGYDISTQYMTSDYVELFRYEPGTTTNLSGYWIATRCVIPDTIITVFYDFFIIEDGNLDARYLYSASNPKSWEGFSYAVRPVVEIDLTKVNIGLTGDGTRNNPYSITAK